MKRIRWYAAGLVAFLVGIPFTTEVFAGSSGLGNIGGTVGDLTGTLIDASGGGS